MHSSSFNMPFGATILSQEIYKLHMAAFYVCCVIGVLVFSVLVYSLIKFRKSKGAKAVHFHEHLGVEIIWTTIPFLILVGLAIPATIVLMHIHNTDKSELTIKITGYQWKWKYEYLDQGIKFFSNLSTTQEQIQGKAKKSPWFLLEVDNEMVVPVETKIRLLVTADDVVHSWWVPSLGVKQDAVAGYVNENWVYIKKPGTYRGQCGELCGVNHGFMPIVVRAVSKAEFKKWIVAHKASVSKLNQAKRLRPLSKKVLLAQGEKSYITNCAMCHQSSGIGLPPTFPALKASKVATGPVKANIAFVLKGVPGTAMQAFGEQLDSATIASILTYVRNSWGNSAINKLNGNPVVVQPKEVEASR